MTATADSQKPTYQPHRRNPLRTCLVGGLVIVAMALAAPSTSAHFRQPDGDWFYSGHTHRDSNKKIDPLTLFFHCFCDRQVHAWAMLDHHWPKMKEPLGVQYKCSSPQNIFDKHPRHDDLVDETRVTGCYEDKWHARIWDSKEHDDAHPNLHTGSNVEQMNIAGVHHDNCCPDHLDKSWEHSEVTAIRRLDEFCAWRNDLHLPGSRGKYQAYFSDGRVTRISPEKHSANGPCS